MSCGSGRSLLNVVSITDQAASALNRHHISSVVLTRRFETSLRAPLHASDCAPRCSGQLRPSSDAHSSCYAAYRRFCAHLADPSNRPRSLDQHGRRAALSVAVGSPRRCGWKEYVRVGRVPLGSPSAVRVADYPISITSSCTSSRG
jgi:hypothetical protein